MATFERRTGWTVLVGLGLGLLSVPLAAAQPSQEQQNAIRSNCRSDYMSNCSSVKPGGIEALQCLQRNVAKLSPGCQSAVNAISPPPTPPRQATAPAAAPAAQPSAATRPAPSTAPPLNAPTAAPQQPVRAATAPPAAARSAMPKPTSQQQAAVRQSCRSDFMSRCSGVQPGGAEALHCLQRNSAQLSPNCQRAVAALGGPAPAAAPAVASPAPASAPTLASAPSPEQQSAIRLTCRRDFMNNCRGVTPGGLEALACLQRNAARLTPDCKTSLAAIAGDARPPAETNAPAAAAPTGRPVGPLRRAIRERMMHQ
jgi:hypothetical protein